MHCSHQTTETQRHREQKKKRGSGSLKEVKKTLCLCSSVVPSVSWPPALCIAATKPQRRRGTENKKRKGDHVPWKKVKKLCVSVPLWFRPSVCSQHCALQPWNHRDAEAQRTKKRKGDHAPWKEVKKTLCLCSSVVPSVSCQPTLFTATTKGTIASQRTHKRAFFH